MAQQQDKEHKGKPIKVSRTVYEYLTKLKEPKEGYDALLRRHFGLESRKGHPQPLATYYIIDTPEDLVVKRTLAEAKGEAILLAVKRGQKLTDKKRKDAVRTVRELP